LTAERLFSSGKGGAKALQPTGHGGPFIRLNIGVIRTVYTPMTPFHGSEVDT
jgi:hypothetical protein